MGPQSDINREKRAVILAYHKDGLSIRKISDKLKIPKSTVHDAVERYNRTGSNADQPRSGRPRVTSNAEDKSLVLMSKRDRRRTAPELSADFNRAHGTNISDSTVKRRLRSAGLFGRVAIRKP